MQRVDFQVNNRQLGAFISATNSISDAQLGWDSKRVDSHRVNVYFKAPVMEKIIEVIFMAGYIYGHPIKIGHS